MKHKREGPASRKTTPSPGQQGEVGPRLLPEAQSLRNTTSGHPTPSHSRSRRRQPQGWREFSVRVVTGPDSDAVHALHTFLREAARRYGLTIARVDELDGDTR